MSETDDQWKEMVKRVYDFANELGVAFKTEKGLYDQRKQALKDINILSTSVEEVVAKSLTMESKDGESDRTYGSLEETLDYNKAKLESLGISEEQIEATNKEAKAENELAKAKNETANATDKVNKAKEKSNKTKEKSNKASKPKQSDASLEEMISIPKSTNKRDYIDGTLSAIKKVIGSSTFKKYATKDTSLKDAINDLDKEAKVNKSSDVGIDYWEGLIKRLKEIGAKGHVQETTIDNMLIPYIGGEIPKSKANKAVKDKAASLGTTSKETVDDAKKIETSTVNTAKAQNDVAKATKVVKVDTNEVAKSTDVVKQNIAETTESLNDLKDIAVSDTGIGESDETKLKALHEQTTQATEANKEYVKQLGEQEEAENKKAESSEKVVDAKKEEAEATQEVKGGLQDIINAKAQESKLENQIVDEKEDELDVANDIADTQKEVVVITQQANEIDQEKLQAMKDELNAKEKLGAEQKVQLQTLKNEINIFYCCLFMF